MNERATDESTDVLAGDVAPETPPETGGTEGATKTETAQAAVAPNAELEALRKEVAELKARKGPSSDDEIVQRIVQHPALKQSQRDMIAFQLKEQIEARKAELLAPIDEMEEAGEIDAAVAQKRRKTIERKLQEEYAARLKSAREEPTYQPNPLEEGRRQAEQALQEGGMTWGDVDAEVREHYTRMGAPMPIAQFRALVQQKASARKDAWESKERERLRQEERAKVQKEIEAQALAARGSDAGGATKPPVGGSSVDEKQQFLKKHKNTGKLSEYFDKFPE